MQLNDPEWPNGEKKSVSSWYAIHADDDDELMLNVLRCQLTY